MKINYRQVLQLFGICFFLTQPSGAGAQIPNNPHEDIEGWKNRIVKELDLTKEQQATIQQFRKNKSGLKKMHLKVQLERLELIDLLKDEEASEKAVLAQLEKTNRVIADLNSTRVKNWLLLKSSLSPEQLRKLMHHVKQRAQHHQRGGGPGWGRFQNNGMGGGPPHGPPRGRPISGRGPRGFEEGGDFPDIP